MHRNMLLSALELLLLARQELQVCQHGVAGEAVGYEGSRWRRTGAVRAVPTPPAVGEMAKAGLGLMARPAAAAELRVWDSDGRAAVRSSCGS